MATYIIYLQDLIIIAYGVLLSAERNITTSTVEWMDENRIEQQQMQRAHRRVAVFPGSLTPSMVATLWKSTVPRKHGTKFWFSMKSQLEKRLGPTIFFISSLYDFASRRNESILGANSSMWVGRNTSTTWNSAYNDERNCYLWSILDTHILSIIIMLTSAIRNNTLRFRFLSTSNLVWVYAVVEHGTTKSNRIRCTVIICEWSASCSRFRREWSFRLY